MANNLFRQLNSLPQNNLVNMMKNASNPQALIMNLARQNPAVANVLKEVEANGGDAKSLFYKKAREMGINPDDILNQLK